MLNVERKQNNMLTFIYDLIEQITESPCEVCQKVGGYAAVLKDGEELDGEEPFALPACEDCASHTVFKGRELIKFNS